MYYKHILNDTQTRNTVRYTVYKTKNTVNVQLCVIYGRGCSYHGDRPESAFHEKQSLYFLKLGKIELANENWKLSKIL